MTFCGQLQIEKIDELVFTELRAQKAEDLEILIWKVKTRTLEHLMLGLVVGTLQNPNQLESLEKLKRIEKCSGECCQSQLSRILMKCMGKSIGSIDNPLCLHEIIYFVKMGHTYKSYCSHMPRNNMDLPINDAERQNNVHVSCFDVMKDIAEGPRSRSALSSAAIFKKLQKCSKRESVSNILSRSKEFNMRSSILATDYDVVKRSKEYNMK
ncbi:hypothetical protein YC2023_047535 [Brassica napus]